MNLTELENIDDDRLFGHLETLLGQIEDTQKKDALLTRARGARELLNAATRVETLRDELDHYEEVKQRAKQDIQNSRKSQEQEPDLEAVALLRMYTDLSTSRLSALQKAELNLKTLLNEGPLTLNDPLKEYALEDEDFFALQDEVRSYQAEYLAVYEECKRRTTEG